MDGRVHVWQNHDRVHVAHPVVHVKSWWHLAELLYHWVTWSFICAMVGSQFLCVVKNTTTTTAHYDFGSDPRLGTMPIIGHNDVPYTDRVVICLPQVNSYRPMLVSEALDSGKATLIDSTGSAVAGYRLVTRQQNTALDPGAAKTFEASCGLIADTLDTILASCTALGYSNLTHDGIQIIDGFDSNSTFSIPDALPVLIMPFWDNAPYARYAIPSRDGDACVFRLLGAYSDSWIPDAMFRGVNRSVRHSRTTEWLGKPDGSWRNGWYEDLDGERWGTEVVSSYSTSEYGMLHRQFDMRTGTEVNCAESTSCNQVDYYSRWGSKFSTHDHYYDVDSVYIDNGESFGFFVYRCGYHRTVRTKYDWESLLSNASIALLLIRWMFAMIALYNGYHRAQAGWHSAGIGCLSRASSFVYLPIAVLPRLKITLCAFWTIGCNFEGEQSGLSEAWFAIYPAIVEFVLVYFSLLNTVAKILRRRVSDVLFAPTILALCVMHYFRIEFADNGWFKGVEARVITAVFSSEVENLQLSHFFTSDVALRLNGNVRELFIAKLMILGINLLPLLFASQLAVVKTTKLEGLPISRIEKSLAFRKNNIGGLGRPINASWWRRHSPSVQHMYVKAFNRHGSTQEKPEQPFLDSYELVRLGYVVYGDNFVIQFDDWDIVSTLAVFRKMFQLWNYRVAVWTLENEKDDPRTNGLRHRRILRCMNPVMCRLDNPLLEAVAFYNISACDIE